MYSFKQLEFLAAPEALNLDAILVLSPQDAPRKLLWVAQKGLTQE